MCIRDSAREGIGIVEIGAVAFVELEQRIRDLAEDFAALQRDVGTVSYTHLIFVVFNIKNANAGSLTYTPLLGRERESEPNVYEWILDKKREGILNDLQYTKQRISDRKSTRLNSSHSGESEIF